MPHPHAADPARLGLCPQRLARLTQVFEREIATGRLPGAVISLQRHGQLAYRQALGQQDPVRGLPMREDSIFRIYSMTKPLVSVAVMMLVEQGKLLLSDPVARHLPEFGTTPLLAQDGSEPALRPPRNPPTVHDLLRHTAGFTYEFLGQSAVQRQYAEVQIASRERSNAAFCRMLASLPLMYEPGTVWAYSRATDVLGRLVEVVGQESLGTWLHTHILAPLGMVDTAFVVPPGQHHRIAEPFPHDPEGGVPMRVLEPRKAVALEGGGGGLMSTVADYDRFLACLLQGGVLDGVRLLSPHTVRYMTADHLGTIPAVDALLPPGHGFGLGFAVRTQTGLAPVPGSVGSYFWSGIAGTTFWVDPALQLTATLMIQAPNQRDHYRQLFRHMVYAAVLD